jgi:hypothetical protein
MSKFIPNRQPTPPRIGVRARKRIMEAHKQARLEAAQKALEEKKNTAY